MDSSQPSVAILLATFNGERFLAEQLDSLQEQTVTNWRLYVSDDGSIDSTIDIIKHYQTVWGEDKIQYRSGPQKGFAQNFLSLACDPNIKANYYAFCDQDDVWLPKKLQIAISSIKDKSQTLKTMYCSRTLYGDEKLKIIGMSADYVHPTSFRNALIQSIGGGNTMVFNHMVKELISQAGVVQVPAHDWWLYILVTSVDGYVYFDRSTQIIYRQHKGALVGQNQSFSAKLERASLVLNGKFKEYITANCDALLKNNYLISDEKKILLDIFMKMRQSHFKDRFRLLEICGLYRQTWRGTITFFFAALLAKI